MRLYVLCLILVVLPVFNAPLARAEPAAKPDAPYVSYATLDELIVFPLADTKSFLEAHRDHPEFGPEFVNLLAAEHPEAYLDTLAGMIAAGKSARPHLTTRVVSVKSWEILFHYVQRQDDATLKSEKMAHYLDVLDKAQTWDMSLPSQLHTFYVKRGMPERADTLDKTVLGQFPPEVQAILMKGGAQEKTRPQNR
jgi:hypothetical protein